jgi:glycosyltransferase involved in cell wall biosynthesis
MSIIKIGIAGTRGIPASYGGFETFAEELSQRLVNKNFDVSVYCDKNDNGKEDFCGVKLKYLKVIKSEHPLLFYFQSIIRGIKECDIVLVCGNSGALFFFLKYFYKNKILVLNTDGVEHRRTKWNPLIRVFLKIVEYIGIRTTDFLLADSYGIKKYLISSYGKKIERKIEVIEYGAYVNTYRNDEFLSTAGLTHDNYYLVVSRLEPENNILTIIEGYLKSEQRKQLIIAGNLLDTSYVKKLRAYENDKIRFIGGVYDKRKLGALRYSCSIYFHGHSVGGTNPSLLESLGSGNIVIAHDNIFNRSTTDNSMYYFRNPEECAYIINSLEKEKPSVIQRKKEYAIQLIENHYNWDNITGKYSDFFSKIYHEDFNFRRRK